MIFQRDAIFDVVGLGVATLDMFTVVEKFPAGREVRRAVRMAADGGGPVATALAALCRLGGRAAMIDRVGGDVAGEAIVRDFAKYHVDTGAVCVLPGEISAAATILVERDSGNRAIFYQPGSAPEITAADEYAAVIRRGKVLHLNGRHEQALPGAIKFAKAAGVRVSFDGGANRYRKELRPIVKAADICVVARDFAVNYTGIADPGEAAMRLLEEGPEIVGVTDGVHGSYLVSREEALFHQSAFSMERVVDTTGCGDSYHGALLYGLTHDFSLREAAALASAVAAINTQTLGGRGGLPDKKSAQAFLAERAKSHGE